MDSVFEINPINKSEVDNKIMEVWNQLEEDKDKTQTNIVRFMPDQNSPELMRYGIFYGVGSKKEKTNVLYGGKKLINLYKKLCRAFNAKAYEIRAIILPDTPAGQLFEHNIQRNIENNTKLFNEDVVNYLSKNYITSPKQQLVLATTDYIDPKFYEIVNSMKWDDSKPAKKDDNSNFTDVVTYYNNYAKPENSNTKDIAYSIVKVKCGQDTGAGILIRTSDQIVCVSCNHIFKTYQKNNPTAVSVYDAETEFDVTPIKKSPNTSMMSKCY